MKLSRLSIAIATACALGSTASFAQTNTSSPSNTQQVKPSSDKARDSIDIRTWDMSGLRGGHSADRLLGTEVRGENGKQLGEVANFLVGREGRITGVIVESQGFMEIGDTHFFVPWKQVKMGPKLEWVQVPVNERNLPNFTLFNDDESIYKPGAIYRGDELMGEFVRLRGGVPYGYVDDVIFANDGRIQAIIVSPDARYGYGRYAYPYYGGLYDPARGYYDMPYGRDDLSALKPFDYGALGIAGDQRISAVRPGQR